MVGGGLARALRWGLSRARARVRAAAVVQKANDLGIAADSNPFRLSRPVSDGLTNKSPAGDNSRFKTPTARSCDSASK